MQTKSKHTDHRNEPDVWESPDPSGPDVWGPEEAGVPSAAPVPGSATPARGSMIGPLVIIILAIAGGVYLYRRHASQTQPPVSRRVSDSKVFTPSPAPASSDLPSGPSGYFIQAEPPADSEPEQVLHLGTPQDRKEFENYLLDEVQKLVPRSEELAPERATAQPATGDRP